MNTLLNRSSSKLHFVVAAFAIISSMGPACAQWTVVPSATTARLHDLWFMNDQVGFCVGGGDEYGWPTTEQGVVLRTADGGDTWTTVHNQADVAFVEVVAYNDTVVCAGRAMDHSIRLRSFDAGVTWMSDTVPYVMDRLTVEDGVLRYIDTSTGLHEVPRSTGSLLAPTSCA